MAQTKAKGQIRVERRPTKVLRKQSWVIKVVFANGQPLMDSEKYSRHVDARAAADALAAGKFEVVDDLEPMS